MLGAIFMNKVQEKLIFETFKKRYSDFPIGHVSHLDKPDFIVKSTCKIGIEVTQVFKDQDLDKGSFLRTKQSFKEHLLKNIVSNLKSTDFPKCVVAIHLNDRHFTGKESARQIAQDCFVDILKKKSKLRKETPYEFNNIGNLPAIIDSYSLFVSDGFEETDFVLTGGSIGEMLTTNHVQFILDKKEEAKKQYEQCDEYWLLIWEGSFEADHFGKITVEEYLLTTTFDKVFLVRQFSPEVIVVK